MKLISQITQKKSLLCVGLDTDIQKIPHFLHDYADPVFAFNQKIIDATASFAVAYKINLAFYECMGKKGWETLEKTLDYIPKEIFTIADAKRGDIGNTSRMYAKTFFETYPFDSITVAPYMGEDSVKPFLEYEDKMVFLLALTSNKGAEDFQWFSDGKQPLYQKVIQQSQQWAQGSKGSLGYVVGATRPDDIAAIRAQAPDAFFLVPGVGAQGGDLHAICKNGANSQGGLLINSSRSILYASAGEDFAEKAAAEAHFLQQETSGFCGVC